MINQFSEFTCERFNKDKDEESWVFKKTLILLGKECEIQIEVTVRYDKDLLIFLMPIYDEGSEGLTGEKLDVFNSLIHQFNSKLQADTLQRIHMTTHMRLCLCITYR